MGRRKKETTTTWEPEGQGDMVDGQRKEPAASQDGGSGPETGKEAGDGDDGLEKAPRTLRPLADAPDEGWLWVHLPGEGEAEKWVKARKVIGVEGTVFFLDEQDDDVCGDQEPDGWDCYDPEESGDKDEAKKAKPEIVQRYVALRETQAAAQEHYERWQHGQPWAVELQRDLQREIDGLEERIDACPASKFVELRAAKLARKDLVLKIDRNLSLEAVQEAEKALQEFGRDNAMFMPECMAAWGAKMAGNHEA